MRQNPTLAESIKAVLSCDGGLSIESEGTVFVRSLEGDSYAYGLLSDDGGIENENVCQGDGGLDVAVDWFCFERVKMGHGDGS